MAAGGLFSKFLKPSIDPDTSERPRKGGDGSSEKPTNLSLVLDSLKKDQKVTVKPKPRTTVNSLRNSNNIELNVAKDYSKVNQSLNRTAMPDEEDDYKKQMLDLE